MTPNLPDMLVFLDVVEARSFTAAAARLGRTKSAVSQAVGRLEQDVGARLLHRSTRSLSLTEAGTRLLARCREIRQTYEEAVADFATDRDDPTGLLTVTAPHPLCAPVLVPTVDRFLRDHGSMRVRLIAEDTPMNLIEAGVDLAVRVGEPRQQSARIARLGTMGESLYASRGYVAARGGPPDDLRDLAAWDHIANEWQGSPITYGLVAGPLLRVEPRLRSNAFPALLDLTAAGLGVARLPDAAARDRVRAGTLVALAAIGRSPIYALHHFDRHPPPKVRRFVALLRAALRDPAE